MRYKSEQFEEIDATKNRCLKLFGQKKNYLLLELLIAFTIVSLCALPLVRNPMASLQSEVQSLERMELERIAELSYVSNKALLHQNEIPWKVITRENQPQEPDAVDRISLSLEGISKRVFERKVFFWTKKKKQGPNQEDYRLVCMKITFTPLDKGKKNKPISFSYDLFMTEQSKAVESENKTPPA